MAQVQSKSTFRGVARDGLAEVLNRFVILFKILCLNIDYLFVLCIFVFLLLICFLNERQRHKEERRGEVPSKMLHSAIVPGRTTEASLLLPPLVFFGIPLCFN